MGAGDPPGTRSLIRRGVLAGGACGLAFALVEMTARGSWPDPDPGFARWRAIAVVAGLYALPAMAMGGALGAALGRRRSPLPLPPRAGAAAAAMLATCPLALCAAAATQWLLLGEPTALVEAGWRASALLAGAAAASVPLLATRALSMAAPLAFAGALAFLAAGIGRPPSPPPVGGQMPRPNLLLVVVDTLRPDHLSCYGYPRPTSPHLDALAARGIVFDDVVAQASFTMPSMATLFTGRLPFEHGVRCHPSTLASADTTLAERFRAAGYRTGAVVSNVLLSRQWGFAQGFDFYDVVAESPFGDAGRMLAPRALQRLGRGEPADGTARTAARWLRRHAGSPFFLWVHFIDPHFPYEALPRLARKFDRGDAAPYEELLARYARGEIGRGELAVGQRLAPEVLARGTDRYDAEIAFADEGLGVLLDALEALGVAGNTLVVVTADHGESLGEHGVNFAHTFTTYESLMRVPLVVAGAGVVGGGRRVSGQASLVDVAPTLLAAAGIGGGAALRGRDLGAGWRGDPDGEANHVAYGENAPLLPGHPSHDLIASFAGMHRTGMEGKWRMVREWPWKLIHIPGRPEGEDLLFQLESDPGEEEDLAALKPDELNGMRARLREFLEEEAAQERATVPEVDEKTAERLRSLGYAH